MHATFSRFFGVLTAVVCTGTITFQAPIASAGPNPGFESSGVELEAWLDLSTFGASSGNDCWGYTAPSGREYAIMGHSSGTTFVEVTDPANPQVVGFIDGVDSTWRDIKTYQTYAYAVSEGGGGVQVMDLSDIDNGNVSLANTVTDGGSLNTHNVYINEDSGYLYRCGGAEEVRIYDLANPTDPAFVTSYGAFHCHDLQIVTYQDGPYAGQEILFNFAGSDGVVILDVTNKANIQVLSTTSYPNHEFTHQGFLSEDRQYLYVNDELDELNNGVPTTTYVFDVSDLENPEFVNSFTNGLPATDHNLYVKNDLIYEANYHSGMRVYFAGDPVTPIEVGYFDTYPEDDNAGFDGLWSLFPFFDSGTVIGSDISRGLFIWQLGELSAIEFNLPDGPLELINPAGDTINVEITAVFGELDSSSPTLIYDAGNGPQEVPMKSLGDDLFEATFPAIECRTFVDYYFEAQSTAGGTFQYPGGGADAALQALAAVETDILFEDNGEQDLGYMVSGDASDGQWERGVPVAFGRGDPPTDADGSGQCWLTDNFAGNSDVDEGTTILTTTPINVPDGALITYAWWLNDVPGGPIGPEDFFMVEIATNEAGTNWQTVRVHDTVLNAWRTDVIEAGTEIEPSETTRLRFSAADLPPGNVIEAGVDAIRVIDPVCEAAIPGDIDGNGTVDVADLLALLSAWGACDDCPEDIDGNGVVDVTDLLMLLANWT